MGAVFGIFIIIAALIYIPYKLWSEATQEQKDGWKPVLIICGAFLAINVVIGSAMCNMNEYDSSRFGTAYLNVLLVGSLILLWLALNPKDSEKSSLKKQERLAKRAKRFYKAFRQQGYPISEVVAEVLAKKYFFYTIGYVSEKTYTWVCDRFFLYFASCSPETVLSIIGINDDDIPLEFLKDSSIKSKRVAVVSLILEKYGLKFYRYNMEDYSYRFSEINQAKEYIKDNLQNKINFNPNAVSSDMIISA